MFTMTPPTIQSIATPPPTALYPRISFFVVSFLIILQAPFCNNPLATINIINSPCLNPTPWECELNLPIQHPTDGTKNSIIMQAHCP